MITVSYLEKINLSPNPRFQKIIGDLILTPNYNFFANVDIDIKDIHRVPKDENVIFAMNHTDRYNYWPFMYKLWKLKKYPFITVWVKGEYYRNKWLAKALNGCNLIPVPSMKYLIEEIFQNTFGRRISKEEYRFLKDSITNNKIVNNGSVPPDSPVHFMLDQNFIEFIKIYFNEVMNRVSKLSKDALLKKGLSLIIFPEGTRTTKLIEGKTGMAQLAVHTKKTIIPVGCSNCENVYKGNLPFAKSGKVVYRVGKPLSFDGALKEFRIDQEFILFSDESKTKYNSIFEAITKIVMENINNLIDERYRSNFP
ncbi:MAG: 1-acyl-sn-glycerol-3-phosphate acyltransferase [Desulfobacterales bacterium]|nr:1-acyl-sn-glycerol-3-phosphate acyltransferase [Desulfobacterales bacterium]